MRYPYPSHRIQEIVRAPKCLREGEVFTIKAKGEKGCKFDAELALLDEGPYSDPRYLGDTHDTASPEDYKANLLLGGEKIRGVDYHPVGRRYYYRQRIPAGWHQDIWDPNLPTADNHRREPLPDFSPAHFRDFIRQTSGLWNIDTGEEATML